MATRPNISKQAERSKVCSLQLQVAERTERGGVPYVSARFRLISRAVVGYGSFKCTDFTQGDVLENFARDFIERGDNLPVADSHDGGFFSSEGVNKTLGYCSGFEWQDAFFDEQNGIIVPAGLNGIISVNASSYPEVAESLELGSIYACSVSIALTTEREPENVPDDLFYRHLGELYQDKLYCYRVTEVRGLIEVSLVRLGADPYAHLIENGSLKNYIPDPSFEEVPEMAGFGVEKKEFDSGDLKEKAIIANSSIPTGVILLSKQNLNKTSKAQPVPNMANSNQDNAKVSASQDKQEDVQPATQEEQAQKQTFVSEEELLEQEDGVSQLLNKAKQNQDSNGDRKIVLEDLSNAVKSLTKAQHQNRKALKQQIDEIKAPVIAEIQNLQKVASGDDSGTETQESYNQLLKLDYPYLLQLAKQLKGSLQAKLPSKCKECGSTQIEFSSAKKGEQAVAPETQIRGVPHLPPYNRYLEKRENQSSKG